MEAGDKIAVLDFGAQYSQLIARRIRELGVYSEIVPCSEPLSAIKAAGYRGLILSGGPSSVYEEGAPLPARALFDLGVPILGICYGMQAMGYLLGGHVVPAERQRVRGGRGRARRARPAVQGRRAGAGRAGSACG